MSATPEIVILVASKARMPLASGARLGPYEILSPLAAGGMGEVYRARDTRLGREVAIKVLPEGFHADEDRLRRFEQEARATSTLNHPNILVVYDVGMHEGRPFLVTELLEGETLRARLSRAALPGSKAADYALQIARGLAAAHAKGVVHRDLKPDNIFLTAAGVVKILDFGLAKVANLESAPTAAPESVPGAIMGSAGYMAPEQVRGQEADQRADIFSFGAVLYEMLSGKRAFGGGTWYEAMNALVQQDPPKLPGHIPPVLERLVHCCLEKRPEDRFQSAHDLILALASTVEQRPRRHKVRRPGPLFAPLATVCCLATGLLLWWLLKPHAPQPPTQLTFRQGTVSGARFTADGQTIVYSASWDATSFQIYTTRLDSRESSPQNIINALLLAVSSKGEMALLLPTEQDIYNLHGTLERAPIGGASKRVAENVAAADWSPDGSTLAIVRVEENGGRALEYPMGTVLYRTRGFIDYVRISPDGNLAAFLYHPLQADLAGYVAIVDKHGRMRTLSSRFNSLRGLAWSKDGKEIWFGGATQGSQMALNAVPLSGKERPITGPPGYTSLEDISSDGRVLVAAHHLAHHMFLVPRGDVKQIDLSWHDAQAQDLSTDGQIILLAESGAVTVRDFDAYLRHLDSGEPVRLGAGLPMALSPDGKWAITNPFGDPAQLFLLPTEAGDAKPLTRDPIHHAAAQWLPDGNRFVFVGSKPNQQFRYWVQDIHGAPPREITGENIRFDRSEPIAISPDGSEVAVRDGAGRIVAVSTDRQAPPRPLHGAEAGDIPLRWCGDQSLIVYQTADPASLYRLDLATGRRAPWRSLAPADPVGMVSLSPIRVSADCQSCAYSPLNVLSDLYVYQGLR
jgi:serine/threonine protein kinase